VHTIDENQHDLQSDIYVLEPECVRPVPNGRHFDMPARLELSGYPLQGFWIDSGNAEGYQRAHCGFRDPLGAT
jgi:hypothetical protein